MWDWLRKVEVEGQGHPIHICIHFKVKETLYIYTAHNLPQEEPSLKNKKSLLCGKIAY